VLDTARTAKALESLRSALTSRGGSLVLTAAPGAIRQQIDVWGPPPSAFQLMRRIKEKFDPTARLNPGRFVGGL
jgi:glycolate oxidase FAD binding subunit